jgi:uncharacterized protein (DUF1778 family)
VRRHYISHLLEAAFEQAKRVLQEYETITLSNNVIVFLLETSDEPNDSIKGAMSEYLEAQ